ncbi:hypothetical protein [Kribbella swartbergensis]
MPLDGDPISGPKVALLTGGLVVLLVGVFVAAGALVRPGDQPAVAAPAEVVTVSPTAPAVTPSRNPRRQPDVDRGIPLASGVFVQVAEGWRHQTPGLMTMRAISFDRGASATFSLSQHPVSSGPLIRPDAEAFTELDDLYGVRFGAVRSLPPPNRNIVEAVSLGFTGRRTVDDVTYSLSGECTRLRGAPAINDVSVSICWAAYVQDLDTVRPEIKQMIGSVAGSI